MSGIHVVVSGITGYIGSQVTTDLLRRGYTVHGTLRRNVPEKLAHFPTDTPGTLQPFEADLTTEGSFDAATANCKYAIHVASPFAMNVKDPQRDMVEPAVKGTINFLRSCKKNGVQRVVLTSSLAAISDGGVKGKTFTEDDWNTHSSLKFLPYYYSKAEAERSAWKFAEQEGLDLVVINPVIVWGPSLIKSLNESAAVLKQTIDGDFYGVMDLQFPIVDVRDVSEAHIRAMENPAAKGRYICCPPEPMMHLREIIDILIAEGFKPPTMDLTSKAVSCLIKTSSYVSPGGDIGQYIRNHLGNPIRPSGAKIVSDLSMTFRDMRETTRETVENMIKFGHLPKPSS